MVRVKCFTVACIESTFPVFQKFRAQNWDVAADSEHPKALKPQKMRILVHTNEADYLP